MEIKAFFVPQGFMIAEIEDETDTDFTAVNPAMIITRSEGFAFAPFLQLVEEKKVVFKKNQLTFGKLFTPLTPIMNEFRKMFGSGLVVPKSNILQF